MRYFMTLAMKSEHFFCSLLTVGQIQDLKKKYEQVFQLTHRLRNLHVFSLFFKSRKLFFGNIFLRQFFLAIFGIFSTSVLPNTCTMSNLAYHNELKRGKNCFLKFYSSGEDLGRRKNFKKHCF